MSGVKIATGWIGEARIPRNGMPCRPGKKGAIPILFARLRRLPEDIIYPSRAVLASRIAAFLTADLQILTGARPMFFSSVVTAIANQAAAKERQARGNGPGGAGDAPDFDAILKAREESKRAAEAAAKRAAENAPAFARFAEKGIDAKMVSFVDVFKEQLSTAVDTNEDGQISLAEMTRQVVAGGGTAAQADTLYDAMDENHDGSVSKQEFQDSTPVPFTNLSAELLQLLDGNRDGQVGGSELQSFLNSHRDTEINAADMMANLAIKVSGNA